MSDYVSTTKYLNKCLSSKKYFTFRIYSDYLNLLLFLNLLNKLFNNVITQGSISNFKQIQTKISLLVTNYNTIVIFVIIKLFGHQTILSNCIE